MPVVAPENVVPIPALAAGEDLSAKQFHLVKLSADLTVVSCAAAADFPIGILNNKPISGAEAGVAGPGSMSKCKAGAAVSVGNQIVSDANGKGIPEAAAAGSNVGIVGYALQAAAAADEIFSVLVMPSVLQG